MVIFIDIKLTYQSCRWQW